MATVDLSWHWGFRFVRAPQLGDLWADMISPKASFLYQSLEATTGLLQTLSSVQLEPDLFFQITPNSLIHRLIHHSEPASQVSQIPMAINGPNGNG